MTLVGIVLGIAAVIVLVAFIIHLPSDQTFYSLFDDSSTFDDDDSYNGK